MTVRTYEEKYSPCAVCCEPAMCATSKHVDIRVEGGDVVPFAVCESCVYNMSKPFRIEGAQDTSDRSDLVPAGTIPPERRTAIAQQLLAAAKQTREREENDRRQQIALWFLEGNPCWAVVEKQCSDDADYHELTVSGKERCRHFGSDGSVGAVCYDKEYKGWDAGYGASGEHLLDDEGNEAIFDTAEEAKAALMSAIPRIIEESLKGMAEIAVENIRNEIGFWFDQLLPVDEEDAAEWLVDQLWDSGYFDASPDAVATGRT